MDLSAVLARHHGPLAVAVYRLAQYLDAGPDLAASKLLAFADAVDALDADGKAYVLRLLRAEREQAAV